jgi:hypothetical protein
VVCFVIKEFEYLRKGWHILLQRIDAYHGQSFFICVKLNRQQEEGMKRLPSLAVSVGNSFLHVKFLKE